MNTISTLTARATILTIVFATVAGCAINSHTSGKRSSVMAYLYPDANYQQVEQRIPHLRLPLRVGVAFVPDAQHYGSNGYQLTARGDDPDFSEQQKTQLLEEVAGHFRGLAYVSKVDVIPSAYLQTGGSFANLRQIQNMYGVDVMALVSYDQVQFTDQDFLSVSYWTIVGAYLVAGEKNDTHTLLDTVVYDIDSEQLLFRAPGSSQVQGRSTPVNLSEELRDDSNIGFQLATLEMINNLNNELNRFEERVKSEPQSVQISSRAGGGGSSNSLLCFVLLLLLSYRRVSQSRRSPWPLSAIQQPR